jgi:hypothetical protein
MLAHKTDYTDLKHMNITTVHVLMYYLRSWKASSSLVEMVGGRGEKKKERWEWWCKPVISVFGNRRQEDSIQGQPGLHSETPSQEDNNKKQKQKISPSPSQKRKKNGRDEILKQVQLS